MGHTITAAFSDESRMELKFLMKKSGGENAVKIPFGRDCDREQANKVMDYHVTLFQWSKGKDDTILERLKDYSFPGECQVTAEKAIMVHGHDDSVLLCLKIKPADGFKKLTSELEKMLGHRTSEHLHVTLAVSQDHSEIHRLYKKVKSEWLFPMKLTVDKLELYRVWDPVEKTAVFR